VNDLDLPPGFPRPGGTVPTGTTPRGGVFAISEVVPIVQQAAGEMRRLREEWVQLRNARDEAKAHAKKVRADLIVTLRVWGNDENGGMPMKTSVERNEWADADANVQQAELEADLAQTAAMNAHAAWSEAQAYFQTLQSMLGMERDQLKWERGGGAGTGDNTPF